MRTGLVDPFPQELDVEIRSAQAMPAGWETPAPAGDAQHARTAAAPPPPPTVAPIETPAPQDIVVLARDAATSSEVLPPQRPLATFRQQATVHPLASAAGRYPLVGKMLEDVFGLDTSTGSLERAANGIDLAA